MIAFALSFWLLAIWLFVGYLILYLLDRESDPVRNALLAPTVGFSAILIPIFLSSRLGIPIGTSGWAILAVVLVLTATGYYYFRPAIPIKRYLPFLGLLSLALIITGRPMFDFEFDWLSFSNDDMANYVMRADRLEHFGFYRVPHANELTFGLDYTQFWWFFDILG